MSKQIGWEKQEQTLNDDAEVNVQLKKEISKQVGMDSIVQTSINDKVCALKQEAITLNKKLQNQKYKSYELQKIIKHMNYMMDIEKRTATAIQLGQTGFENLESLERKIRKYQYDLDQINSRTNKISSVITEKKHTISLMRTQRVIDSGIFRNIEKELIQFEMDFKKLLIQKIKHQKAYFDLLSEYNSLKLKANTYFQSKESGTSKRQQTEDQNHRKTNQALKNEQSAIEAKRKFKELSRQQTIVRLMGQNQKNQKQNFYEFSIKKFLLELGVADIKEFYQTHERISQINQKNYEQLNRVSDATNKLQAEIKAMQEEHASKTVQFYKSKPKLTKNQVQYIICKELNEEIKAIQKQTLNQNTEITNILTNPNLEKLIGQLNIEADQNTSDKKVTNTLIENQQGSSSEQNKKQGQKAGVTRLEAVNNDKNADSKDNKAQLSSSLNLSKHDLSAQETLALFQRLQKNLCKLQFHVPPLRQPLTQSTTQPQEVAISVNNISKVTASYKSDKKEENPKLQEMIKRVKVFQQSDKIMQREEFKRQYSQLMNAAPSQSSRQQHNQKRQKKIAS